MKNVKKVLALMLAITMMFGVVSVCASAIDTTTASYKFTYKDASGNVIDSAKAGDVVDVVVGIKTDGYSPIFEFIAFYDYVALTQISSTGSSTADAVKANNAKTILGRFAEAGELEVSDELLEYEANLPAGAYGCVMDWGYGAITVTLHKANMYPSSWGATEKAQYKAIKFAYKTKLDASVMTVNTNNEFVDVVSFRFIANADTALNNTTFILSPDASKSYISIYPDDECLSTAQTKASIKVENLVVEYGTAGGTTPTPPPAATVKVNNLSTQVQWANKDAGLMNLGFRGQIAEGYDATADDAGTTGPNGGKNLAKLTEVGFYLNGTKYQSYTIYNFTNNTYFYRVIVGNVSYDSEKEFSAQAYVVIDGAEYKADDATTITTTGKAQYERAKDAMGAK